VTNQRLKDENLATQRLLSTARRESLVKQQEIDALQRLQAKERDKMATFESQVRLGCDYCSRP
jgi:hypothetical protein